MDEMDHSDAHPPVVRFAAIAESAKVFKNIFRRPLGENIDEQRIMGWREIFSFLLFSSDNDCLRFVDNASRVKSFVFVLLPDLLIIENGDIIITISSPFFLPSFPALFFCFCFLLPFPARLPCFSVPFSFFSSTYYRLTRRHHRSFID